MEKLLFLAPDVDTATAAVGTLRQLGLSDDEIGVLANDETRIENLPDADVVDESDIVPAVARGVAAGGATGLLAGLAALAFPPAGLVAGGAALVSTITLGGASFGAFAAALVGTSVENSQLREFEEAVNRGEILIIADVEDESRLQEVRTSLEEAHSALSFHGTKPDTPPAL